MALLNEMKAPAGGDYPTVFLLERFRYHSLNQAFYVNPQITVCGHPTFWDRDCNHFMYFQEEDHRWVITPKMEHGVDLLMQAQQGEMLGCAYQYVDEPWHELVENQWKSNPQAQATPLVRAQSQAAPAAGALPLPSRAKRPLPSAAAALPNAGLAKPAAPPATPLDRRAKPQQVLTVDTVHVRGGFNNPSLNTIFYLDAQVSIGNRATYWDENRRWFMYYQAPMKRWAISVRDPSTGEDMFEDAKKGGLCGFAFEVEKQTNMWKEFFEERWVTVQLDMHKLSTGKRAPPASTLFLESRASPAKLQVPKIPAMAVKEEAKPKELELEGPVLKAAAPLVLKAPTVVKEEVKDEEASTESNPAAVLQEAKKPEPAKGAAPQAPERRTGEPQGKEVAAEQAERSPDPAAKGADEESRAKQAEKLKRKAEKEERAREKERALKEKIRQELRAKVESERGGFGHPPVKAKKKEKKAKKETGSAMKAPKQSESPKAALQGAKTARGRRKPQDQPDEPEPSSAERPAQEPTQASKRPRWKTSIAAKWPT